MADDLVLSKSVERSAVVAAIESLQSRGADVNPYSLAEELHVSVSLVVGSGEAMELVCVARREPNGVVAAEYDRLLLRVKELEDSSGRFNSSANNNDLQDECRLLQARVDEEAARSRRMEEETRMLRNRNDAMQNELNSLKAAKNATVEILRPSQDDLSGLFVPGLPSAEAIGDLKAELETLRNKCQSLEYELAANASGPGAENSDIEIERLRKENAELTAFKSAALSEEEQQALSDHLATMTAKQTELNMLIDHLQRENARLASGGESVLTAEELSVLREHIDNLSAHNAQLSEQIQILSHERAELAARQLETNEQLADLQEHNRRSGGGNADSEAAIAKLEAEKGKLKETVAALESANQLLATSLQETYQQGYQAARLEFAREHFAQITAHEAQQAQQSDYTDAQEVVYSDHEKDYQGVPEYMNSGLFDESPEGYCDGGESVNDYGSNGDAGNEHWADTGHVEPPQHYAPDGVNQEETCDKFEMLEQQRREAAASQLNQQYQQQQSYGSAEEYVPEAVFGDPSAVHGFATDGYSPYAKVDVEAYGFADVPADDDKSTTAYSADELRDLVQHRLHQDEPGSAEGQKTAQGLKKFVGGSRNTQEVSLPSMPRNVPPDIRKACLLLGLKPEELNRQNVFNAWKREMAKPGVHPDTGGDTEMATYLNTAKDRLVRFLEETAPKLGKKFGTKENPTREQPKPKK